MDRLWARRSSARAPCELRRDRTPPRHDTAVLSDGAGAPVRDVSFAEKSAGERPTGGFCARNTGPDGSGERGISREAQRRRP